MSNKEYDEAKVMLEAMINDSPEDPVINYHCAAVNDALGYETKAIPYYRRALENGVSGDLREAAYIQLGSSYRCIGEYDFAGEVLEKGLSEFPENPAMKVFYNMTLYNKGDHKKAFTNMLADLVSGSSEEWIRKYEKALRFYSEDVDKVWR
ncbi:hypothetical protein D3H55_03645 [Bacillus salacetis]|uniref:Tetratrico peptide repeat group 5 domain-containing protein n=1 Tax=Bacillus salacetis TaxID=2315464 RepID=A0A3A1R5A0_9BACI|nr:hypothetical protein D3H55_03645 [Bacillus salacetis]